MVYTSLSVCRNAAAMNFANQFLNDVKACACQYECFLFLVSFPLPSLLLSLSFSPSFLQVLTDSLHIRQLIHWKKKKKWRAFICSPDLERICIRANRLSLVRDHQTLHIALEAAISVSCFYSTGKTRPCTLWISRYVASITFKVTKGYMTDFCSSLEPYLWFSTVLNSLKTNIFVRLKLFLL